MHYSAEATNGVTAVAYFGRGALNAHERNKSLSVCILRVIYHVTADVVFASYDNNVLYMALAGKTIATLHGSGRGVGRRPFTSSYSYEVDDKSTKPYCAGTQHPEKDGSHNKVWNTVVAVQRVLIAALLQRPQNLDSKYHHRGTNLSSQ